MVIRLRQTQALLTISQDGCSSLSKSKIAISLSDAEAKGYEPCSKCCNEEEN